MFGSKFGYHLMYQIWWPRRNGSIQTSNHPKETSFCSSRANPTSPIHINMEWLTVSTKAKTTLSDKWLWSTKIIKNKRFASPNVLSDHWSSSDHSMKSTFWRNLAQWLHSQTYTFTWAIDDSNVAAFPGNVFFLFLQSFVFLIFRLTLTTQVDVIKFKMMLMMSNLLIHKLIHKMMTIILWALDNLFEMSFSRYKTVQFVKFNSWRLIRDVQLVMFNS